MVEELMKKISRAEIINDIKAMKTEKTDIPFTVNFEISASDQIVK